LYLKPHLILGLSGKVLDNSDECGFTSGRPKGRVADVRP